MDRKLKLGGNGNKQRRRVCASLRFASLMYVYMYVCRLPFYSMLRIDSLGRHHIASAAESDQGGYGKKSFPFPFRFLFFFLSPQAEFNWGFLSFLFLVRVPIRMDGRAGMFFWWRRRRRRSWDNCMDLRDFFFLFSFFFKRVCVAEYIYDRIG